MTLSAIGVGQSAGTSHFLNERQGAKVLAKRFSVEFHVAVIDGLHERRTFLERVLAGVGPQHAIAVDNHISREFH